MRKRSVLLFSILFFTYACGSDDGDSSSAITEETDKIFCGLDDGSVCWEYTGTECPSSQDGGMGGGNSGGGDQAGDGGMGGGNSGGGRGQAGGGSMGINSLLENFAKLNITACPTEGLIGICVNTSGSTYFYDEMKANQRKNSCAGDNGAWTDV